MASYLWSAETPYFTTDRSSDELNGGPPTAVPQNHQGDNNAIFFCFVQMCSASEKHGHQTKVLGGSRLSPRLFHVIILDETRLAFSIFAQF